MARSRERASPALPEAASVTGTSQLESIVAAACQARRQRARTAALPFARCYYRAAGVDADE